MSDIVRYVGLDVHKRVVEACMLDAAGKVLDRIRFDLDRTTLLHFAQTRLTPHDRVALEATTNCFAVARILRPFVAQVVVSNPLVTKAIAEAKVKTDKVDALVLAQLLQCEFLPCVWQPDEATSLLRELTSRRIALVQDRTAVRNRIHSLFAVRLITEPANELFGATGGAWLVSMSRDETKLDVQGRMVQAAHTVARHPGPLGHFFKKLAKRKNYNVAVVATARKLVVIAVQMLKNNEPYRYALSRSREEKLRALRVRATGKKRKSGPPAGEKCKAKLPGGSRTIKSLARVCQEEGVTRPRPRPWRRARRPRKKIHQEAS